jgi:hypothetical protein
MAGSMDEKRTIARQRTLKGATVVFSDGQFTYKCLIKNLTPTGASLEFSSTDGVPNQFQLVFEDRSPTRTCKVVWRTEKRLGVEFVPDN